MSSDVKKAIVDYLEEREISHTLLEHEPVVTSEEAARIRDLSPDTGAKALVLKVGDEFKLFVIQGSKKMDSKKIRKHFGAKKSRFCSEEELLELTGLVRGSVPPFGKPILPLEVYLDTSIGSTEKIAFNIGSRSHSIIMKTDDYLLVHKDTPQFTFSVES